MIAFILGPMTETHAHTIIWPFLGLCADLITTASNKQATDGDKTDG
jgi:hypothetical protein